MSFKSGRQEGFHGSRSLFPLDGSPTTLTTENGSQPAFRSAGKSQRARQSFHYPAGRRANEQARVHVPT